MHIVIWECMDFCIKKATEVMRDYIKRNFTDKGMCVQFVALLSKYFMYNTITNRKITKTRKGDKKDARF